MKLTVKVGFSTAEVVTDSTTEAAELETSSAADDTEDAAPSPKSSISSSTSARAKAAEQASARRADTRMAVHAMETQKGIGGEGRCRRTKRTE